jgi:hypothetical protein
MQAYADAWQDLRRGVFTTANLHAMLDAQQTSITDAVAVRSGLAPGDLAVRVATLKTWVEQRAAAFDAQFPAPPVFSHPGGNVPSGFSLGITAPAGSVYMRTDGGDPRARGGGIAPQAVLVTGSIALSSNSVVVARAWTGTAWSGRTEGVFVLPRDLRDLRLTEIHYHPAAQTTHEPLDGDFFEFLELKNTGALTLDLTGLILTNGVSYSFLPGQSLGPGAFLVLARDAVRFISRHGQSPDGEYVGRLNNGGEELALLAGSSVVWAVTYDNNLPWPPAADGLGPSLQRPYPSAAGHAPSTWWPAAPTPWADLSLLDGDADGMPDAWEAAYGLGEPGLDADGDGFDNRSEFLAGTHPGQANSRLWLARLDNPEPAFQFQALAHRVYRLQTAHELGSWVDLEVLPADSEDREVQLTPAPPIGTRRYYRLATP